MTGKTSIDPKGRTPLELFDEWVEALRSGDYLQTTRKLKQNSRYCCLGVLCNIVDPSKWRLEFGFINEVYAYTTDDEAGVAYLPDAVQALLDPMDSEDFYTLTKLNDEQGLSFTAIADFIVDEFRPRIVALQQAA